jgi:hypothetical protein
MKISRRENREEGELVLRSLRLGAVWLRKVVSKRQYR